MPRFMILVACLTLGLNVSPLQAGKKSALWRQDFKQAEKEAKRLKQPMLVHFYAAWCGPCRKMEAEVLNSQDMERLGDRVVAVKVNIDDYPELGQRFKVQALPQDVVVSPEGAILRKMEGYQTRAKYVATVSRTEQQFSAKQKVVTAGTVAKAPAPAPVVKPVTKAAPTSPAQVELGQPESLVGLDGFCPVTLWKTRTWVRGSEQFPTDYQGVTYYFRTSTERQDFRKDPARYAPRLLGCDPVRLNETEKALPGSSKFAAFYDGELFLFDSHDSRVKFRQNPPRYISTRHVLKSTDIVRQ